MSILRKRYYMSILRKRYYMSILRKRYYMSILRKISPSHNLLVIVMYIYFMTDSLFICLFNIFKNDQFIYLYMARIIWERNKVIYIYYNTTNASRDLQVIREEGDQFLRNRRLLRAAGNTARKTWYKSFLGKIK